MRNLSHLVTVLLITLFLGGCGPETPEDSGEAGPGEFPEQEQPFSAGVSWTAPNPATPLASTADMACFFTGLGGAFDKGGDSLRIAALRERWHVDGTGSTRATAACTALNGSDYTTAYDWAGGQEPTNLGAAKGRVCFLTRVSGSFNHPADWIGVYQKGDAWFLSGSAKGRNGSARARCITVSSYSDEYTWTQDALTATDLGPAANKVCALTSMAGEFDSASEFVEITKTAGHWYLSGSSSRSGVTANARCF